MATITAITAQQKNKNRVNLYLDGEFFCGLDAAAMLTSRIKVGDRVEKEDLAQLIFKSESAAAFSKAAAYLGIKSCSLYKMERYLAEKGYDSEVVTAVIERLTELNYLDDLAYAAAYVKSCRGRYGNALLKHKLKEQGISSLIIGDVLPKEDAEEAAANQAAEKYLKTHKPDKNKLYTFLFNKGFSADAARAALNLVKEYQDKEE